MSDRKGYFEVADGGTIFLDEVGELPTPTQARLLRVLETGEFIKVGSSKVQKTNVRIVAATNVNLVQAVSEGKFREDLYYRLNTVPIQEFLPLRERPEDIVLLFRKFASDCAEKYRMPPIRLDDEARQLLVSYRWPGNVRELKKHHGTYLRNRGKSGYNGGCPAPLSAEREYREISGIGEARSRPKDI